MAIVVFDIGLFRARYPEFSSVEDDAVSACWNEGGIYLDNTDSSPVANITERAVLLNMLAAHVCAMNFGVGGDAPSGLVGRISSATQGSVSVSAEYGPASGSKEWFIQTKYGAAYWQATARYRMPQYSPGRSFPASRLWSFQ